MKPKKKEKDDTPPQASTDATVDPTPAEEAPPSPASTDGAVQTGIADAVQAAVWSMSDGYQEASTGEAPEAAPEGGAPQAASPEDAAADGAAGSSPAPTATAEQAIQQAVLSMSDSDPVFGTSPSGEPTEPTADMTPEAAVSAAAGLRPSE